MVKTEVSSRIPEKMTSPNGLTKIPRLALLVVSMLASGSAALLPAAWPLMPLGHFQVRHGTGRDHLRSSLGGHGHPVVETSISIDHAVFVGGCLKEKLVGMDRALSFSGQP